MQRDDDILAYFEAFREGKFSADSVFDEVFEKEVLHIFMKTSVNALSYMDILETLIQRNYYTDYEHIQSSIFFICPDSQVYYHFTEYQVKVGAQHFTSLLPVFQKYQYYLDLPKQNAFLSQTSNEEQESE